ncbi:MAG: ECF transporter S component [Spirochaetota bacterium]
MNQQIQMQPRNVSPAYRIASIAVLTAVTAVFTLIVRIPIAPTRGYINLGDVAIYFAAYAFGPVTAGFAGGLGTGLADIFAGYPHWALISFFIHGIQGFAVGAVIRGSVLHTGGEVIRTKVRVVFSGLLGTVIMVGLYYLAGAAMSGFGPAAVEIPGNIVQNIVGIVGGLLLTKAVLRAYPPLRDMFW